PPKPPPPRPPPPRPPPPRPHPRPHPHPRPEPTPGPQPRPRDIERALRRIRWLDGVTDARYDSFWDTMVVWVSDDSPWLGNRIRDILEEDAPGVDLEIRLVEHRPD